MELPDQVPQNIEQVREEIERCNYQLNTLFDIGKDIFGILDIELILKNSLLFTLGNFGVIEGFIGLYDSLTKQSTQFVSEGFQDSDIAALQNGAKKTLLENNLKNSAAIAVSCRDHDLLPDSVNCVLPFKVDDHRVGMLGLGSKLVSGEYTSDEKKLVVTIVNNMVVALQNARSFAEIKDLNQDLLENKKKLETTLDKLRVAVRKKAKYSKHLEKVIAALNVAQEVQQSLLPQYPPEEMRFDISGGSRYCDETGGDYYDYIISDNDENEQIGIAVGDVSGHGISSALLMAAVRSSLRQRSSLAGSISRIMSDVNRQMAKDVEDSGQFITMLYLTIDPIQKSLQWVRAGHDPGIFYDPHSDTFEELHGLGVSLGVIEDCNFAEYSKTALEKGQIIFLSTDGLTEARNNKGDMFGNEPVYNIIRKNASSSANDILDAIFESLNRFVEGTKLEDDITLVVVKIKK